MDQTPEDSFIETIGVISSAEGWPPISGRILGYLVLADGACSLTDIAEALNVSKASVSTNVRLLEAKGIAVREARRGSRQDHWRVETRPHRAVLESLAERFQRNARRIDEIATLFPDDKNSQRQKVEEFSEFYRRSSEFLASWSETLDNGQIERTSENIPPSKTVRD